MKIGTTNITGKNGVRKGFTLIELLVTIAIFVFMTALILARYSSFNSGTLLTNAAYDVALAVKEAQTYGIGVITEGGSGRNFNAGYGLFFAANDPNSFVLFADKFYFDASGKLIKGNRTCDNYLGNPATSVNDCMGSTASPGEGLKKFTLKNNVKIEKICGVLFNDVWPTGTTNDRLEDCNVLSKPWTGKIDKYLNIVVTRPDPGVTVVTDNGGTYKAARIYMESSNGGNEIEAVEIAANGQITVKQEPSLAATLPGTFSVSLAANPNPVGYNAKPTLSWQTNYAAVCSLSAGTLGTTFNYWNLTWTSGVAMPSNTITASEKYTISCDSTIDGSLFNDVKEVIVSVLPPAPLDVSLTLVDGTSPFFGDHADLAWGAGSTVPSGSSSYYCVGDGFQTWNAISGTVFSNNILLGDPVVYSVTCYGPTDVSTKSLTVTSVRHPSSYGSISIDLTNPGYDGAILNHDASGQYHFEWSSSGVLRYDMQIYDNSTGNIAKSFAGSGNPGSVDVVLSPGTYWLVIIGNSSLTAGSGTSVYDYVKFIAQ